MCTAWLHTTQCTPPPAAGQTLHSTHCCTAASHPSIRRAANASVGLETGQEGIVPVRLCRTRLHPGLVLVCPSPILSPPHGPLRPHSTPPPAPAHGVLCGTRTTSARRVQNIVRSHRAPLSASSPGRASTGRNSRRLGDPTRPATARPGLPQLAPASDNGRKEQHLVMEQAVRMSRQRRTIDKNSTAGREGSHGSNLAENVGHWCRRWLLRGPLLRFSALADAGKGGGDKRDHCL